MQVQFHCYDYFREAVQLEEMRIGETEKHKISYQPSLEDKNDVLQLILKRELLKTSSSQFLNCYPKRMYYIRSIIRFYTKEIRFGSSYELGLGLPDANHGEN